jgi:hypothetical protein
VQNAILYLVAAAGFMMLFAGAYGLLPAVFGRRRAHAGLPATGLASSESAPSLRSENAALAQALAQTLTQGTPSPVELKNAAAPVAPSPEPASKEPFPLTTAVEPEDDGFEETRPVDPDLLTDLISEVWLLRAQIEALRGEIGGIARQAGGPQKPQEEPPSAEARRRSRPPTPAELPLPLRRQLVDIRRQRKSA